MFQQVLHREVALWKHSIHRQHYHCKDYVVDDNDNDNDDDGDNDNDIDDDGGGGDDADDNDDDGDVGNYDDDDDVVVDADFNAPHTCCTFQVQDWSRYHLRPFPSQDTCKISSCLKGYTYIEMRNKKR